MEALPVRARKDVTIVLTDRPRKMRAMGPGKAYVGRQSFNFLQTPVCHISSVECQAKPWANRGRAEVFPIIAGNRRWFRVCLMKGQATIRTATDQRALSVAGPFARSPRSLGSSAKVCGQSQLNQGDAECGWQCEWQKSRPDLAETARTLSNSPRSSVYLTSSGLRHSTRPSGPVRPPTRRAPD